MFLHYLKMALRNARKRKAYSLINIAGLAVGIACCILILVFVASELSYDRYHGNADRLYRVGSNLTLGGTPNAIASTNAPPAFAMKDAYPEVIGAARLRRMGRVPVRFEDRQFYEDRILYADNSILELFTFPIVSGDHATPLEAAYTVVLTESTARKYFGDEDAVGRVLRLNETDDYAVTGVVEDVPRNSHFSFDFLCSMETLNARNPGSLDSWMSNFGNYSYVLLEEGADHEALVAKLPALVEEHAAEDLKASGAALEFFLQPLTSIHLHSNLRHELAANSDISYVYTFGFVALAILLIACFNFMNLATARSSARAKEVAVRKVLGADRRELIKQFLAESLLYSFVSLVIALGLAHLAMPVFGKLLVADSVAMAETGAMTDRTLSIDYGLMPWLLPSLVALAIFVGLVAGSYPALFLASFHPSRTLHGGFKGARGNTSFRRILVTLQFTISLVLIIATGVVYDQLQHIKELRLGFDKSDTVVIPVMSPDVRASLPAIREELLKVGGVVGVSASSHVLGGRPSGGSYVPEDFPEGQTAMMDRIDIDDAYIDTLGMSVVDGRNFSREFSTDPTAGVLINEAAARRFGWNEPVGKTIKPVGADEDLTVVGVVGDFHFSSPHRMISPIFIGNDPSRMRSLFVKVESADVSGVIAALERKWRDFDPHRPFEHFFLDTSYDRQFGAEENLSKLFASFAALAIFIACLGLFGIATFTTERRTKEIGIRKVLGASVSGLVFLLSRELIALSAIAGVLALPIAYLIMRRWLESFPYRLDMDPLIFAGAAVLMMLIGFATVSFHSIRAALRNPVHALRCE